MKKSEQGKEPEGEDGIDMISNLPDHVLQLILSGIPSTEEVIRTSILSKKMEASVDFSSIYRHRLYPRIGSRYGIGK